MKRLAPSALRSTVFLCCDLQEKFAKRIVNFDGMIQVANELAAASIVFQIPYIVTEQYPQGLGKTDTRVKIPPHAKVFAKNTFSMMTPEVNGATEAAQNFILFGIESHVCVLQTAADLRERNKNVFIVHDGVSSQRASDREAALLHLAQLGCITSSSESLMFQLLGDCKNEHFKGISNVFRARPASQ